jgi:hypothetical protein
LGEGEKGKNILLLDQALARVQLDVKKVGANTVGVRDGENLDVSSR